MPPGFDPTTPEDAPKFSRSDIALLRQSARGRWAVPDILKTEAVYQTYKILVSPDASDRDKIAANKALTTFDKVDQDDDKLILTRAKLELEREKLARSIPRDDAIEVDAVVCNTATIELDAWRKEMAKRLELETSKGPKGRADSGQTPTDAGP